MFLEIRFKHALKAAIGLQGSVLHGALVSIQTEPFFFHNRTGSALR